MQPYIRTLGAALAAVPDGIRWSEPHQSNALSVLGHYIFASRRGLLPSVRVLVDFLVEQFAELKED